MKKVLVIGDEGKDLEDVGRAIKDIGHEAILIWARPIDQADELDKFFRTPESREINAVLYSNGNRDWVNARKYFSGWNLPFAVLCSTSLGLEELSRQGGVAIRKGDENALADYLSDLSSEDIISMAGDYY